MLKKDWQNNDNYPKISEEVIYVMLRRKSSSIVKWIFIISIIELSLGLILSIGMSFTKYDDENAEFIKTLGLYEFNQITTVTIYTIVVYFIIQFYRMYRKVSTTDNTKQLMNNILRTRKIVQNYILFNLVTVAIFMIIVFSYSLKTGIHKFMINDGKNITEIPTSFYLFSILGIIIITGIITGAFWLIYKLAYGILLKKLKKNFEELKKIDL